MNTHQNRIALFIPTLYGGGAERVTINLLKALVRREFSVDLVLVRAEGELLSEVPREVRVVDLGASRILGSLLGLIRYFRKESPDALLSALDTANLVALCAHRLAQSSATIAVVTHNTLSVSAEYPSSLQHRVTPFLVRHIYPFADAVVTVSEGAAEDLSQVTDIPYRDIHVVYNPIVTKDLHVKAQENVVHPWLPATDIPVILGVGRLTSQKNFPLLLRAFAKLREMRDARLIILGEGEDRCKLITLAKRLKIAEDLDLVGFVDNPLPYLRDSTVFALSSNYEGLPTVIIEALACGCPVVSTNCPSGPEEILQGGRWGALVPTGDKNALATAISETIDSPRRSSALQKRAEVFDESTAVDRYVDILIS